MSIKKRAKIVEKFNSPSVSRSLLVVSDRRRYFHPYVSVPEPRVHLHAEQQGWRLWPEPDRCESFGDVRS